MSADIPKENYPQLNLTEAYRYGLHHMNVFRAIDGWLTDVEGFLLYMYARNCTLGEVVEIGSFKGKSTCWLASALKESDKSFKVHAVDWHKGSPEFAIGQQYQGAGLWTGDSFPEFKANLEKFNLWDNVTPILKKSKDAVIEWSKPIGLLFIDGDHTYESARFDFMNWTKFIPVGGTVIMHDATTWEGPKAVVNEFITGNDSWVGFSMDSVVVATKVK